MFFSANCFTQEKVLTKINLKLTIPKINVEPYFNPYVAVWLESEDRKALDSILLWYQNEQTNKSQPDGKKWLKDLRQWWRKIGRQSSPSYDSVTSATRKPGVYRVSWKDHLSIIQPGQKYFLNIEAAREEGGRTFHRVPVVISDLEKELSVSLKEKNEFGKIEILVEKKSNEKNHN